MSIILVCRDAREDSIVGNLALGLQLQDDGADVAVLFTGESLKALTGEMMFWPPLLKKRPAQMQISRAAEAMGFELAAEFDSRWIDTDRFLAQAVTRKLNMIACPIWTRLLGLEDALPDYLARPDQASHLQALREAEQVIGGY